MNNDLLGYIARNEYLTEIAQAIADGEITLAEIPEDVTDSEISVIFSSLE